MRIPLTLLVTGGVNAREAIGVLNNLGAAARYLAADGTVEHLKLGTDSRLVVDAIVIDGRKLLWDDGVMIPIAEEPERSAKLATAIRQLSDAFTMRNGVRWNRLPIVILVDDREIETSLRSDNVVINKNTVACAVSRGWQVVYKTISDLVLAFTGELIDEMRSLGWHIAETNGRFSKVSVKFPRRHGGVRPRFETERYSGYGDLWTSLRGSQKEVQSLVTLDERGVNAAFELFEASLPPSRHTKEQVFQELYLENPYMLGAASFELIPHPQLVPHPGDSEFVGKIIPDFVAHLFSDAPGVSIVNVIELKRPDMSLIAGEGAEMRLAYRARKAIQQAVRYSTFLNALRYSEQNRKIFGEAVRARDALVIAGSTQHISNQDKSRLLTHGESGTRTLGFDEHFEHALHRYTFVPSEDLIEQYSSNRGFR